jgi:hypothetical protein
MGRMPGEGERNVGATAVSNRGREEGIHTSDVIHGAGGCRGEGGLVFMYE